MMNRMVVFCIAFFSICACKKDKSAHAPVLSSDKEIVVFDFYMGANTLPWNVKGKIRNDTIMLKLPKGSALNQLTPTILFKGKAVVPAGDVPQDFSVPVKYTITAEDGSKKQYTVIVKEGSGTKRIISFLLKASENEGLKKDVIGNIANDTVLLYVPAGPDLSQMKPTIVYEGDSISPAKDKIVNLNNPAIYTVYAEDGGTAKYTVCAGNNHSVYMGCYDGYVYALDGVSLKVKWKYKTLKQPASPTYAGGMVYMSDVEGTMYAIDAETGVLKWQFYEWLGSFATPVVYNGVLYASIATKSLRGMLYAFDCKSGAKLWVNDLQYLSYSTVCSPVVKNGLAIVTLTLGGLYAVDAASGALKWRHIRSNELMYAKPLAVDNVLYYGDETYDFVAVDALTGKELWTKRINPSVCTAFCTDGSGICSANRSGLQGFNIKDPSLTWKYTFAGTTQAFCNPVAANGLMYSYSAYRLYAINMSNGSEQWHYDVNSTPNILSAAVNYANGLLYFNAGKQLLVMDPLSGAVKTSYTSGADISELCIVDAEGRVFNAMSSGDRN